MLKKLFKQAVLDTSPAALAHIRKAPINLAVWEDALSPASKKYLQTVDLEKIAMHYSLRDGYYYHVNNYASSSLQHEAAKIKKALLKHFPRGQGKNALANDIGKLMRAFQKATGNSKVHANFLVFTPSKIGFWHTDSHTGTTPHRGIMSMIGDRGTLWRSDESLPKKHKRTDLYWGSVQPEKDATFCQEIAPLDFAIFKCNVFPNPLVHATPPTPMSMTRRLAFIVGD